MAVRGKPDMHERELQLLCVIAQAVLDMSETLDDLAVLAQQQNDLLRRMLKEESAP